MRRQIVDARLFRSGTSGSRQGERHATSQERYASFLMCRVSPGGTREFGGGGSWSEPPALMVEPEAAAARIRRHVDVRLAP